MDQTIDLNKCRPGDRVLAKNGTELEYVGCNEDVPDYMLGAWRHVFKYITGPSPNGIGTRTDNGHVYHNSTSSLDIEQILTKHPRGRPPMRTYAK
jgi:hypothetical protein